MEEGEGEVTTFLRIWQQLSRKEVPSSYKEEEWNNIEKQNGETQVLNARFELGRSDLYRRSSTFPLAAVNAQKIEPYQFTQIAGRKGILQAMQSSLKSEQISLHGQLQKATVAMLKLLNISDLRDDFNTSFPETNDEVIKYVRKLLDPTITINAFDVTSPVFLKALDKVLDKLTKILSHASSIREWIKNLSIAGLELGNDAAESFVKPVVPLVAVKTRALDEHSYDIGLLNACMAFGFCALPLPKQILGPEIRLEPQGKVSLPQMVDSKWYTKGTEIPEVSILPSLAAKLPVENPKWCQWTPLVTESDKTTVASNFDRINHRRALEMATSTLLDIASQSSSLFPPQKLCALLLNLPHTMNLLILGPQPTETVNGWWAQPIYQELRTNRARQPPLLFENNQNILLGASVGLRTDADLIAERSGASAYGAAKKAFDEALEAGSNPDSATTAARDAAAAAVIAVAGVVAAANAAAAANAGADGKAPSRAAAAQAAANAGEVAAARAAAARAAAASAASAAASAAAMVAGVVDLENVARCSVFKMDPSLINTNKPGEVYTPPKNTRYLSTISLDELYPSDYSKHLVDSVLDLLHKLELNECEQRAVKTRLTEDEHATIVPAEVEVTKRRKIVWDDATRTAALSGDRLYNFYRQLSGTAGESMNGVVQIDDSQYQRDLVRSREQATKLSTAASERFAGLIESTFAGLFRQSGLTFAIGNDATKEVSIVSGNLRKQLTDLAQSEVGGLFQKSVELETLIESANGKLTLTELVRQLTAIGDVLQRSTYMAAYNPTSTLSIETVAQPSNSLVLNVRDVATAAVNIAYDNLERELKYHYHRMRVPILYELVEGPDASLSNAFATLCAHVMVQQRLHAGAAAAYVTKWSASINARMLGVALKRAVDAVCVYVGKYHDPHGCITRNDFFKPK
jgi:hypothetical protein